MSRALLIVANEFVRQKALNWVLKAPLGTRIEFKEAKRTNDQNALLWASLTDIAQQCEHHGRKYPADAWKAIFMSALGKEMQFVPALDGKGFITLGHSSSDLSTKEMADLITMILAWGGENGVEFHEPRRAA
jgi:NinB protein